MQITVEQENITLSSEKELSIVEKLKIDPYYFERKKELERLRADIESGKEELGPLEKLSENLDLFLEKLEKKYASNNN